MVLANADLIAGYAADFCDANYVRLMHFKELLCRQAFFQRFKGEIGDIFFVGGVNGDVVLQRFYKSNLIEPDL